MTNLVLDKKPVYVLKSEVARCIAAYSSRAVMQHAPTLGRKTVAR